MMDGRKEEIKDIINIQIGSFKTTLVISYIFSTLTAIVFLASLFLFMYNNIFIFSFVVSSIMYLVIYKERKEICQYKESAESVYDLVVELYNEETRDQIDVLFGHMINRLSSGISISQSFERLMLDLEWLKNAKKSG